MHVTWNSNIWIEKGVFNAYKVRAACEGRTTTHNGAISLDDWVVQVYFVAHSRIAAHVSPADDYIHMHTHKEGYARRSETDRCDERCSCLSTCVRLAC
jgi:hypothetical protein